MTFISTASALVDDFVRSGSFLRNQVSACDYGIIDTSQAGCIVVLQPAQSSFTTVGYGGAQLADRGVVAECYIKVDAHVTDVMTKVWQIHDSVLGAVRTGCMAGSSYPTLIVEVTGISKPRNQFLSLSNHDVIPVYVNISIKEDP